MRIQLLNPPSHESPTNLNTGRPTPPIGLAYIAAALRKAGHEVSVLDAVAEAPTQITPVPPLTRLGLLDAQIIDRIDPRARAIGIGSTFTFNWPALRTLIHAIHERHPDKLIVCGGEHFSALPEVSMRDAPIDYVVMGEGEETAVELFAGLEAAEAFDPTAVEGLCWRRGDEIVRNPRRDRTRAVDEIAWPAWDLFDLESYDAHDLRNGLSFGKTIPVLATRGCPYQCTYCSSPRMWTTRWYARDPRNLADEIEHYTRRYGATNFPFHDLTMIVKRDWVVSFCREIIARKLDITWQLPTGTRCEVVDEEVAVLLWQSGCRWICYAPESGSERTRKLIKKKMETKSLERAVEASSRARLRVETFFVIGFPHDTPADLRETVRLARWLGRKGVEDIAVSFFFPIPATELFDQLAARGRVGLDDTSLQLPAFSHGHHLDEARNFCDGLSARQLTRWKYWIVANFYAMCWASRPIRVLRILRNVIIGRQTTVLEKFLGDRRRGLVPRFVRRRAA
jgi:radical SAM superfamily enzyme YgiQ (UPF0313 family)